MSVFRDNWTPVLAADNGYQSITCAGTAVTLTIPSGASAARIQVLGDSTNTASTKAIRFRMDGTAPTTSEGQVLGDLDFIELTNKSQMTNFKAIQYESGKNNNALKVQYYYTE